MKLHSLGHMYIFVNSIQINQFMYANYKQVLMVVTLLLQQGIFP
jgi:hypothetical protein